MTLDEVRKLLDQDTYLTRAVNDAMTASYLAAAEAGVADPLAMNMFALKMAQRWLEVLDGATRLAWAKDMLFAKSKGAP